MVSYKSLCVHWRWPNSIQRFQVVTVLFGAFLVHLSLGSVYTFGNMVPYLVSYIRNQSQPVWLRSDQAPIILACQVGGQGATVIVGGVLEKHIGPRLSTLIGGWLMSAGVLLTFFTIRISFWLVLVTYGLMFGFGIGTAYVGPVTCAMKWLPKWKAVAGGMVVAGFGLSATVFNAIQTFFINPTNEKPNETPYPDTPKERYFSQQEILERVPYCFLILGGTYAVMQFIGCVFLVNPPPPEGFVAYAPLSQSDTFTLQSESRTKSVSTKHLEGDEIQDFSLKEDSCSTEMLENSGGHDLSFHGETRASSDSMNQPEVHDVKPQAVLCRLNFYLLWTMFMLAGICIYFLTSLYKQFGFEEFGDDHFLTAVGSVSAVFNLLGRLLWGLLADTVTYKFALVFETGLMTFLFLTLIVTVESKWMFFVWICGLFFCVGGNFSLFPAAIARSFGQKYLGVNYGLLFSSQIVGSVVNALLASQLVTVIHWWGMFFVLSGLSAGGLIIALCYPHDK